jgi:hypothetical protein
MTHLVARFHQTVETKHATVETAEKRIGVQAIAGSGAIYQGSRLRH